MKPPLLAVRQQVPLRDCTTLALGGDAAYFFQARRDADIQAALAWATERRLPVTTLGGGSNVVIADAGLPGLVLQVATRGVQRQSVPDGEIWRIAAGENWDDIVAAAVAADLAGIECLSGIPGSCGAAPIQNIGAYGQDVAETLVKVEVIERATGTSHSLPVGELAFAYRNSRLKREPGRWIVTSLSLHLRSNQGPALRYPGLEEAVVTRGPITLASCRAAVLALRRGKSMIHDPADPNHRSAGSFFLNPILPQAQADTVQELAYRKRLLPREARIPSFPAQPGYRKIPAAWLIEQSGFSRGQRHGPVGLSSRHTLALVHHGGGRTEDLIAFAMKIRTGVEDQFGVRLEAEPVMLGFTTPPLG